MEKVTPEALASLTTEIEVYAGEERTNSRNLARKTLFTEFKNALQDTFPDALKGADIEGAKYDVLLKQISEKAKVAPAAGEQEPQETPAQMKARLESENAVVLKKEREAIRRKGFIDQLKGEALAAGLDPVYADSFTERFEREYGLDLSKDQPIIMKADEPYYLNGKPVSATDVVSEIFTKYSAFKKTQAQTGDPNVVTTGQEQGQAGVMEDSFESDLIKDMPGLKTFVSAK